MKIHGKVEKYRNLSEKNRIVLINVVGAFVIKGLSLIVSLLTTPAYISFFNDEIVLGIWFTILSVLSWILNFDLGIGNGLRNHLAKAYAANDYHESKKLISSAYVVVGVVCLMIIVIAIPILGLIDWNIFFNVENSVVSEIAMEKAVAIVFVGIILQIFFKLISSILYAVQKSSVNNAISLFTALVLLIAILVLPSKGNDQNIVIMAVVYVVAVLLPYVIASVFLFSKREYRRITPSFSSVDLSHAKKVLSLGGYFFVVQVLYMLIMSTNEYMITNLTLNSDVVEYRVYFQIFTLGSTVFALALTPIWSAITKAIAEADTNWVERLYKKLLLLGLVGVFLEFLIIPILQIIFNVWLGSATIPVNIYYAIPFAALGGLMIFNGVFSSVANGAGKLGTQLIVFLCGALLKIPLAYIFVKISGSWIGVVIATDIILLVYCIVQPITLYRYLKQKMHTY